MLHKYVSELLPESIKQLVDQIQTDSGKYSDGRYLFKNLNCSTGTVLVYEVYCTNVYGKIQSQEQMLYLDEAEELIGSEWAVHEKDTRELCFKIKLNTGGAAHFWQPGKDTPF